MKSWAVPKGLPAGPGIRRLAIYSLGATIYRALCGQPPLWDSDEKILIKSRLTLDAPPASSLRPELCPETVRLLSRMLRRKRRKRFQSAEELLPACRQAYWAASRRGA